MRDQERTLNHDVEHCVNVVQNYLDTESAKAISVFNKKSSDNEDCLEEIRARYQIKSDEELYSIGELRGKMLHQLEELEDRICYYEKLCDELEEFQNEIEVRANLEESRHLRVDAASRK